MTGNWDSPHPDPRATAVQCGEDVCITCSDEAIPVRVVEVLEDDLALVDVGSTTLEQVSVALVDARVGDQLLVHAKEAIAVVEQR